MAEPVTALRHLWRFLSLSAAVLVIGYFLFLWLNPHLKKQATAEIGGEMFFLDIARTPSEQARGLGGRESVPSNGGMLFIFDSPGHPSFWMKGMMVPIDIIWLNGDMVVLTKENAEPPPDASDSYTKLEVYAPPDLADKVIEVAAGTVKRLDVRAGQKIKILLP